MTSSVLAIGDIALDIVLGPLPLLPEWGEEAEVSSVDMRLGGNLGNFLVAARRLGLDVACAGLLGDDDNGLRLMRDIQMLGFSPGLMRVVAGGKSPVSIGLFRNDGERLFVTYPGVLADLGSLLTDSALPAADVVFLTGWCQPPRIDAPILSAFCRRSSERGAGVVMDLSWNSSSWAIREDLLSVLGEVDVALMNRDELAALSGIVDVEEGLERLGKRLGAKTDLVAKLGAQGAMLREGNGKIMRTEVPVVEGASAVGAGDNFNAGFIEARFEKGLTLAGALTEASIFASTMMRTGREQIA
jgi:sugar/nucleoside kinase (ribokinase family)